MTQLEYARRGLITEKMQHAAAAEGVSPEFIRDGIAAGTIVICHNVRHTNGTPLAVGAGLVVMLWGLFGWSMEPLTREEHP